MMVDSIGDIGSSMVAETVRMATDGCTGLLVYHCFMWFVVCGGSVIVAQYARRR